jgi:hypothetical protein
MGKNTIIENIKEWLAGKCWDWFLKLNNLTEAEYFSQIAEQESKSNAAIVRQESEVQANDVLLAEFDKSIEEEKKPFGALNFIEGGKDYIDGVWEGIRYSRIAIQSILRNLPSKQNCLTFEH